MLPDTFGFLRQSIDQAALALWPQLEHNIRLALAGEVAKVKSFPGHLNFGEIIFLFS
jgi:hypothetical protein